MTPPEFSRPERIDAIGAGVREIVLEANEAERAALAARFGLLAIDSLAAVFRVHRESGAIVARGTVRASLVQACVATADPVSGEIDELVALRFVEEDAPGGDEVELDADELDTIGYSGGAIDLGEAAAETMALALDPFPRSPAAAEALRAAGVISEEEARPLSAFAGLKAALDKPRSPQT